MRFLILAALILLPASAQAQEGHEHGHAHAALGHVEFANSGNDAAQAAFQRGVALLHSFEYTDAITAFEEAQRADPSLAVAYWLHALAYSRVVWGYENLEQSRAVLARLGATSGDRLARAKTTREREFGAAVEAFLGNGALPGRARAFADAMLALAAKEPDHEMSAFAALASMMAWFTSSGADRERYNAPVRDLSLRVFRENPQHPGAAHYLIHFVDMNPDRAADALEFARAYDRIAPDAEHALHMPSHVYLPLGMWSEVVGANERSWAASRREVLERGGDAADFSWHALDWLQYSYLQLGRHADARALVDTAYALLRDTPYDAPAPDARNAVNMAAFRYGWETGDWSAYPAGLPDVELMLRQPRQNDRAAGMAVTAAYQAAVAALRSRGDAAPAERVIAAFRTEPRARRTDLLASQLEAMVAFTRGDRDRAVTILREIAPAEPGNASVPPTAIPSWELLGEYLLEMNRHAEAEDAFARALHLRVNRAAAQRGLERARTR